MSGSTAKRTTEVSPAPARATIGAIFLEFLLIGATSFGGGVVAYLRNALVAKRAWITDKEFLELLSISQSLPGLNATNMGILVGDRLRGIPGALAAIVGVCLPGGALMYVVGMSYQQHGERALIAAILKGVAAAAVGLVLATAVQLGKRSLPHRYDLIFTGATVIGVNRLHFSVLTVLIGVGLAAILWYYPGRLRKEGLAKNE